MLSGLKLLLAGGVFALVLGLPVACLGLDDQLVREAKTGNAVAENKLGMMCAEGRGVRQNYPEAEKWYRKAANQGYAPAQANLGVLYETGRGVTRDYAVAVKWYRKAAENGSALAQSNLGLMYAEAKGVAGDDAVAAKWFRKSAEQGHATGQYNLGVAYAEGMGVRKDDAEAAKWFRRAAEQGYGYAQNNLGVMYAKGRGVRQNITEAVKWVRKAANQGDAVANGNLGVSSQRGGWVVRGVPGSFRTEKEAIKAAGGIKTLAHTLPQKWFRFAAWASANTSNPSWSPAGSQAAAKHACPNAGSATGIAKGPSRPEAQPSAAPSPARKVASKSSDASSADQENQEGLKPSTAQKEAPARALRMRMLEIDENEFKVDQQIEDFAHAQFRMGLAYYEGNGREKNYAKAIRDFKGAAKNGSLEALFYLALMLERGHGVPKNREKARTYLETAASKGHEKSREKLQRSESEPSPTPSTPLPPRQIAQSDENPPKITALEQIEAGENGMASIRGSIQDTSEIASFTVDGLEVPLSNAGEFEIPRYIPLGGEKRFELVAIDAYGNSAAQSVTATRVDQAMASTLSFPQLNPGKRSARPPKWPAAALVIGIEDYKRMPEALYARTDASVFFDYAHHSLGIPKDRIIRLEDSDADNIGIQDAVRRLGGFTDEKTDLFVYFAGHGFASGKGVPYLLPHDGDARYLNQLVSRDGLFELLAGLEAGSVTAFLDTCYSGRGREGIQLAKGMRPLVIASPDQGVPEGFTVISAASSDEWSGDLPEAEHGLFSYFLMRGLGGEADANGDRAITVEELHDYVSGEVGRQAARLGREQTPELYGERNRVLVRY